jgi:membrane-bound lytic murein transglycosylase B
MARHRLVPNPKHSAPVRRSYAALLVWALHHPGLAAAYQGAIRAARTRVLSVAVATPVVLVGAGGAAAPQIHPPTTVLRSTAISPVAAVTAAGRVASGPAVVAVARPPTSFHIAAAAVSAPPPAMAVNSPGALGIPAMALSAYRNAERLMAVSDPACGISWNLLAGIGRIESMHANGGATDARGTAIRPIYGPALDGTLRGNEVIIQSKADGQVTYARAMGPMQFLPGTWARYAADGDGDGVADPQNLYDSTLAAARYLCSGGLNLRDPSQAMSAILRYNNSMAYSQNVLGWAAAYATGVVPVDLPPMTGPPPPLGGAHDEHPEGLGPGLPMNVTGLQADDPLATPLIDLGQRQPAGPQPMYPWMAPTQPTQLPGCTIICVGSQSMADPPPPAGPPPAPAPNG